MGRCPNIENYVTLISLISDFVGLFQKIDKGRTIKVFFLVTVGFLACG
jgi:hypothetical protein